MAAKDYILPSIALIAVIVLLFYGPIPQDPAYHNFADQRRLFGIPNFLNVITNLPFIVVGALGLKTVSEVKQKELKPTGNTLFAGFLLVAAGSSYYHLFPNNATLVYDRIPIAIILMSFFAFIIHECINPRMAQKALLILNVIGLMSVVYWAMSERAGNGDLRLYGMVQFYPIVAIPLMLILYKPSFSYWKEIILIFFFFAVARLAEVFDKEIYKMFGEIISGHSLKHLLMAIAGYEIVVLIRRKAEPY